MAECAGQAGGADVVLTPLEQDSLKLLSDQTTNQWDILVKQLFLEIDGMGADQCLASRPDGVKNGGYQVGE